MAPAVDGGRGEHLVTIGEKLSLCVADPGRRDEVAAAAGGCGGCSASLGLVAGGGADCGRCGCDGGTAGLCGRRSWPARTSRCVPCSAGVMPVACSGRWARTRARTHRSRANVGRNGKSCGIQYEYSAEYLGVISSDQSFGSPRVWAES